MKKTILIAFMAFSTFCGAAQSWLLVGNTKTNPDSNFVGTTDSTPLRLRVFNNWAGEIEIKNSSLNTSFGYLAFSSAPPVGQAKGVDNSAFGALALRNLQKGNGNTAVGFQSLESFNGGSGNTAVGINALVYAGNVNGNTAIGGSSLYSNKTGEYNTAVGVNSLYNNRIGGNNVAVGNEALNQDSSGSGNTAIGTASLLNDSTGFNNTAVGFECLTFNKTGTFITALGSNAGVSKDGLTNSTAIGNGAIVDLSNTVVLGNSTVTVIGGNAPWSNLADGRFKYNIHSNVPGLEFIKRLTAVSYMVDYNKLQQFKTTGVLKEDHTGTATATHGQAMHTGFVAQEVEKICKEIGYDFDGIVPPAGKKGTYSLAYAQFIVPVVKALQEQQVVIEAQQEENKKLKEELNRILLRLDKLEKGRNN